MAGVLRELLLRWQCARHINLTIALLIHWGRVTHICVGKLTIIDSDNGLSPGRRPAITWTNAGILLIGPLGTNFSEILIGIQIFSFKKIHLKMSSGKWRPSCLGLSVLIGPGWSLQTIILTILSSKLHYNACMMPTNLHSLYQIFFNALYISRRYILRS